MTIELYHYRDLNLNNSNVEYQVHTTWTDGQAPIRALLTHTLSNKLDVIAFTEHVRRETDWFSDFMAEVRNTAKEFPRIKVYLGCEAKALDTSGKLDVSSTILEQCDIVLGSVHRFPDKSGGLLDWNSLSESDFARIEFELALGLVMHAPITVLAHPGGMFERKFKKPFPQRYYQHLMYASLETNVAIEINSSYQVDFADFLSLCNKINPLVSIGSDVHKLEDLGYCRNKLWQARGWN